MAIRAIVLVVVSKQAYTRYGGSRTCIVLQFTLPSRLTQISTPVEFPILICGALSADLAFDPDLSAVALLLLYFSWALSSSGDQ